jgi:hypothetical protein
MMLYEYYAVDADPAFDYRLSDVSASAIHIQSVNTVSAHCSGDHRVDRPSLDSYSAGRVTVLDKLALLAVGCQVAMIAAPSFPANLNVSMVRWH